MDTRRHLLSTGFHSKQLVVFLVIGLGVALLFGLLYFQEWRQNRRWRHLTELARLRQARAHAAAQPAPPRLPLIRVRAPRRASASPRQSPLETPAQAGAAAPAEPPAPGNASASERRGRLEICADDPACEVFVDGAFIGNAPARLTVPEGMHRVEVKHPSGAKYCREIRVSEAADLRLQAVLENREDDPEPA